MKPKPVPVRKSPMRSVFQNRSGSKASIESNGNDYRINEKTATQRRPAGAPVSPRDNYQSNPASKRVSKLNLQVEEESQRSNVKSHQVSISESISSPSKANQQSVNVDMPLKKSTNRLPAAHLKKAGPSKVVQSKVDSGLGSSMIRKSAIDLNESRSRSGLTPTRNNTKSSLLDRNENSSSRTSTRSISGKKLIGQTSEKPVSNRSVKLLNSNSTRKTPDKVYDSSSSTKQIQGYSPAQKQQQHQSPVAKKKEQQAGSPDEEQANRNLRKLISL